MKYTKLLLILTLISTNLFGQEPAQTFSKFPLLGVKNLPDGSMILLSTGDKHQVLVRKLNKDLQLDWQHMTQVPDLSGFHYNQMQLHANANFVYVIQQLDHEVNMEVLRSKDGQVAFKDVSVPLDVKPESRPITALIDSSSISFYLESVEGIDLIRFESGSFSDRVQLVKSMDVRSRNKVLLQHDNQTYYLSYLMSKDHNKMNLKLSRKQGADIESTKSKEHELELDGLSFTYNSMVDKGLLAVKEGSSGFYLFGKNDMLFDGSYPASRTSEAFIGVWVAKFSYDLELEYFRQIPFSNLGIVKQGAIKSAAVYDIKEDFNGQLILAIRQLQDVTTGNKYVIFLDSEGSLRFTTGGVNPYNFFEYDNMGLRNTGRADRIRLMNDDWTPYVSNILHIAGDVKSTQSAVIQNIQYLARESGLPSEKLAYTFFFNEEQIVILEYQDKKSGRLNLYLIRPESD